MTGNPLKAAEGRDVDQYSEQRVDLACAFRWTARLDLHEGVANHFSLVVDDGGGRFLMNPKGRHFSRIKASELLLVDAHDDNTMARPDAPDPTAWSLHGAIHRRCPSARCVLHVHSTYATVLASLADSTMPPIDQNTARFFNRMVVDEHFDGMGLGDEAERCSRLMEGRKVMLMGNHGLMVAGPSVADAFDNVYYFERAARNLVKAYATGRPLRILSDDVAEKTARQWEDYPGLSKYHFRELKAILDFEEPDYRG